MTVLLVASVGGHLSELTALADRIEGASDDRLWVTWRSPQSESVLAGERVLWVPPIQPREATAVVGLARRISAAIDWSKVSMAVSTGSALALSVLPVAAARGVPCHYIECATRADSPSLTGRVLRRVPGVAVYTQHRRWACDPWRYAGSVFDGFAVERGSPRTPRRVVVTVGTMGTYGFRRLLERVVSILPADVDVLWQTGCTPTAGLGITPRPLVPGRELARAMRSADAVVGHCGTGTALTALQMGKLPVLVPRRARLGEHVDDHQLALAESLAELGLAIGVDAERLSLDHLAESAGSRVVQRDAPPMVALAPGTRPRRPADVPIGGRSGLEPSARTADTSATERELLTGT